MTKQLTIEGIEEAIERIASAKERILGTVGSNNTVVFAADLVIPELTPDQLALIEAIMPSIGPDGYWYIGSSRTNVIATLTVPDADGGLWAPTSIGTDGTGVVWTKLGS